MKKYLIGLVLISLLSTPLYAALSNGFETDYIYANVSGASTINIYSQADGSLQGSLAGIGEESITFSCSPTPGVNTPKGARFFGSSAYDWDGNGTADDIRISEWDAAGNIVKRAYLGNSFGGGGTLGNNAAALRAGSLRYNPVKNTLIVGANVGNNLGANSKAWEFSLPDWAGVSGNVSLVHTYTLPAAWRNRTNIAINPNDGMMYMTGYDLGSGKNGKGNVYETPTVSPTGVNTLILNGATMNGVSGGCWYKPAGITYRELDNGTPELIVGMENVSNAYQPFCLGWNPGSMVHGGPYPVVGRYGTPGDDVLPAQDPNRVRAIHAQTDPLTGEAFLVGNEAGHGDDGGILSVTPLMPRNTGSMIIDGNIAITDAASPAPEPATLLLLGLGALPLLRRRR